MGIDLHAFPGLGLGLLALLTLSFVYAVSLNRLASARGPSFFLPGLIFGILGFLIYGVLLQFARGAFAGVEVGAGSIPSLLAWLMLPGVLGSWFACRSVLKGLRRDLARNDGISTANVFRPVAAFWGGLALCAFLLLLRDFRRFQST
jgi:hypothetical protein